MSKEKSKIIRKKRKYKGSKYKIAFIILFVLLILSLVLIIKPFEPATVNKKTKPTKITENKFTIEGELFFLDKNAADTIKKIAIEIADTDYDREKGLMHRYSMPDTVGMLFIFSKEEPQSFWMKNTYISLDIVFLNKEMKIVTIQKYTEPLTEWQIPSYEPAKYIIEINAGFCDKYKIEKGNIIMYKKL